MEQEKIPMNNPPIRGAEKRYIPRWIVQNKVLYRPENNPAYQETSSHDINCSGASFYCKEDVLPRQKIKMVMYLSETIAVEVTGTVLWKKDGDQQNLIGVRFEETPLHVQDMILQYAFEHKKEDLTRHWFKGW